VPKVTARLVLIAHASTAAIRSGSFPADESLDDLGRAEAGAHSLQVHPSTRVLASPAARTAETARLLGLSAEPDSSLDDWNLGSWRGWSLERLTSERPQQLSDWLADPTAAPHGGESLAELLDRMAGWLDSQTAGLTVAVTHPAIVRAAMVVALTAGAESFWRIDIAPLTSTALTGLDGRWNLRASGQPLSSVAQLNRAD
jgi:broad specificity phosphatase PhoE